MLFHHHECQNIWDYLLAAQLNYAFSAITIIEKDMSDINKVLERIKPILEELQKSDSISVKTSIDKEADIIRIYREGSDYIKRASSGLSEILELAYTTAEHHPYWLLLFHAAEICKMALEKWESDLSADQLSEIAWRCDEIKMAVEKLATKG